MPHGTDTLYEGEFLRPGEYLKSKNELFSFRVQNDGRFVLFAYKRNGDFWRMWESGTGKPGIFLCLLGGRIFLCKGNDEVIFPDPAFLYVDRWDDARLVLQDDGNMVVYNTSNDPTWDSRTFPNYQDILLPNKLNVEIVGGEFSSRVDNIVENKTDGPIAVITPQEMEVLKRGERISVENPRSIRVAGFAPAFNHEAYEGGRQQQSNGFDFQEDYPPGEDIVLGGDEGGYNLVGRTDSTERLSLEESLRREFSLDHTPTRPF